MSQKIRGITIEIGGDTSELVQSFNDVNERSKDIQKSLGDVNKLLKFDPKNMELLSQKSELLRQKLENSKVALAQLEDIQKKLDASGVSKTSDEYMALQREIEDTKISLNNLEKASESANKELNAVKPGVNWDKIQSKVKNVQKSLKDVGSKMQSFGNSLSMKVTAPLSAGFALVTEGTREFRDGLSKLEVNASMAGASLEETKDALKMLNGVTGETDSNIEAISNLLQAGFKDTQMLDLLEELSGAVIAFPDTLKIEGLADGLQETLATGKAVGPFSELLERSGVNLDTFNEGLAEAKKKGEGTNYALQQLSKLGLKKTYKGFKDVNKEQIEASDAAFDMQKNLAEIGKKLEPIMTKIKEFINGLLDWFNGLGSGGQTVVLALVGIVAAIGPVLSVLGSLITVMAGLSGASATAATALATAGTAATGTATAVATGTTVMLGPIALVVGAIAGVIAIGVLLWKNWETISAKASEIWNTITTTIGGAVDGAVNWIRTKFQEVSNFLTGLWTGIQTTASNIWGGITSTISGAVEGIKNTVSGVWNGIKSTTTSVWNGIKSAITSPVEKAKEVVGGVVDKIKGIFNFNWSLPKLKLPRVSITGGFSLFPLKVPKFSIDWFADGGIFNKPTIIPTLGGLKGVGEYRTGGEVVAPLDNLKSMINDSISEHQPTIINHSYFIVDGKEIATHIAPQTDIELGRLETMRSR